MRSVHRSPMAQAAVAVHHQRLRVPVPHRPNWKWPRASTLPIVTVVGVDNQWGLEVGVYKRTFGHGNTTEPGVHWGKFVRFDKIAEGLGCGRHVCRKGRRAGSGESLLLSPAASDRHPRADRSVGQSRRQRQQADAELRRVPHLRTPKASNKPSVMVCEEIQSALIRGRIAFQPTVLNL